MSSEASQPLQPERTHPVLVMVFLLAAPFALGLTLFLAAGTLSWTKGWWFILILFLADSLEAIYSWRSQNANQLSRPLKRSEVTQSVVTIPAYSAILVIAALDDGRFHWIPIPWYACILGYVFLLLGKWLVTSAETVTRKEGGRTVLDSGPFAVIRHPETLGIAVASVGTSLCLGSLIALIPAMLLSMFLALQSHWINQTLSGRSADYRVYAERVRFNWVPGLW